MSKNLLTLFLLVLLISSCVSSSNNSIKTTNAIDKIDVQPELPPGSNAISLTELPRTEDGAFVLQLGFYEAEFKTFCLQPGTPDPRPIDAYLQMPVNGNRKEIVETILMNSRKRPDIEQRNVQLLLWSVVSHSDFNKLSNAVQRNAMELLTKKQVFELRGGIIGVAKTVSANMPVNLMNGSNDIRKLFETGYASYEAFEKIAVLREAPRMRRADFKNDQWYKQKENYYVRHFPMSYQKIKIQVYVPDGVLDSTGKADGEYLVFDPTGYQSVPANSNAQRLGIGGPVVTIIRSVIKINKTLPPKTLPETKNSKKVFSKT